MALQPLLVIYAILSIVGFLFAIVSVCLLGLVLPVVGGHPCLLAQDHRIIMENDTQRNKNVSLNCEVLHIYPHSTSIGLNLLSL